MEAEIKQIVEDSLIKARSQDSCGNVGQAYAYYTVVVEFCPEKRPELEEIYTDVLCEWGMQLELSDRLEDVIKCYKTSIRHYPNSPRMLNNLAAHFLRIGEPLKAIKYLKRVTEVNPRFLPVERNLQNAYSMIINEWHFCMLNDKHRNHAFDRAIRKAVSSGYDTVLDIGTGTGLLSLYAHSAGSKKTYACEYSPVMCDIASKVFQKNGASDVKLIPKMSTDLKVPEDLQERVKLVVTETFDAALFGECVLPTLIHAHHALLEDGGIVLPMSASLYAAAVECEYIRFKSNANFQQARHSSSLDFSNISVVADEDFYDTENLKNVEVHYVTEPENILTVNFNDLKELEDLYRDGLKNRVTSKCRYNSTVDGLVVWFKLHLDEETEIDSSRGKSCWQYAVFPAAPKTCLKGDEINLTLEIFSGNVKCSYGTSAENCKNVSDFEYKLPTEIVTFLNDLEYIETLGKVVAEKKDRDAKKILDTCPFPIYGLEFLKNNSGCETLFFQTENEVLRDFVERVAEKSGISKGRVNFVSDFREIECALDDIFIQNFDTKGEPKDWGQQSSCDFFRCLLSPSGSMVPQRFYLMGQLIFSNDLPNMMHVRDANVQRFSASESTSSSEKTSEDETTVDFEEKCTISNSRAPDYAVAEFINAFSVNHVFDLNSSLYLYDVLSEEKVLVEMGNSGELESTVDFGKIDVPSGKPVPNALLCWYRIGISEDCKLDTRRKNSFINHTAIVLENELKSIVSQEKNVRLRIYKMGDLVKIVPLL